MSTRRTFLQQATAFSLSMGASRLLAQQAMEAMKPAAHAAKDYVLPPLPPMLRNADLTPFVDRLPLPHRIVPGRETAPVSMREVHAKVHRDVPPTRFWIYTDARQQDERIEMDAAISPLIEARKSEPLHVEWINHLPQKHFLPIDFSLHGCGRDLPEVRAVVHLHGARTRTADDGYPTDWYVSGQSRTCHYPMQQDAAMLWYHDHAMGLNRLNVYAGLAGMAIVRDEEEDALHLPSGEFELPIMLADRYITPDGQLFYPTSGDPEHPWVPEFYAETVLVNGKISPFVEVEPRLYRLRVLNAANSRFFALRLSNGQPLTVIGSDQGLLEKPVQLKSQLLAPAERTDILVDFSQFADQSVQLNNGFVPLMQFRVASRAQTANTPPMNIPDKLRTIEPLPEAAAHEDPTIVRRTITLEEIQDQIQNPMVMLLNRKHWHEPVTETPRLNATEIWEFVNLTEDTHPMHLHMVRFRILERQTFEPFDYQTFRRMKYLAPATKPAPEEAGWKDIAQCPPGMVTRILVKFEGYTGKYVYHCHVLEHESNDMMRPFEVVA